VERPDPITRRERFVEVIQSIPRGRWTSYSAVGRALLPPHSGRLVGQMMKRWGHELPWWRVARHDGTIALVKLDPAQGKEQVDRMAAEGVRYDNRLDPAKFWDPLD
jgi:alkylated DNA nucleotide flippase Atl1